MEASTIVEEELGDERWKLLDAYRSLQDARVWSEPLIRIVGNESAKEKENEDIVFELTENGEKVWKAVKIGYSELTKPSNLKFEK